MIADWIAERAIENPGRLAAIWNSQRFSYDNLSQLIESKRRLLLTHRLPEGIAVLLVANLFRAWCWMIALRSLGYDTVALKNPQQIIDLRFGSPGIVITDHVDALTKRPDLFDASITLVLSSKLLPSKEARLQPQSKNADSVVGGHILLSSGTTGTPKKVLVTAAIDEADVKLHAGVLNKSTETRFFAGSFLLTTGPGYRGALRTWAAGGAVIFAQQDDASEAFLDGSITDADFTPMTLSHLLETSNGKLVPNNRMRVNIVGGALPWRIFVKARSQLTEQIYSLLGATEAGTIARTKIESEADLREHNVVPKKDIQVVRDNGEIAPPGEIGFLRVSPIPGISGYLDDESTSKEFFKDGFFYTGDLARWVREGRLEIVGRSSSVIHVLGDKRSPEPIEQRFRDRFGLSDVCIFSSPGKRGGDALHVVLETSENFSNEVMAQMNDSFSSVDEVYFHYIEAFPRNVMGKFMRAEIRRQAFPT